MKVFEFDQSATFIMSMTETLFLAAEIAADLVERPLKVEVSIPESFKTHFIHLDKVEDVTGLCGESIDRNKGFGFYQKFLDETPWSNLHNVSGKLLDEVFNLTEKNNFSEGFFGLDVLFNLGIVKLMPSCLKTLNYKSSLYKVSALVAHTKAINIVNLKVTSFKERSFLGL